jgi:TP53 regulating kinase-like protein
MDQRNGPARFGLLPLESLTRVLQCHIITEDKKEFLTNVAKSIGAAIGKLHDAEIVHGDLTTSNIMVTEDDSQLTTDVVLIDFGLGMMKPTMEDKAVDLYVLERAFISTHPGSEYLVGHYVSNQIVAYNLNAARSGCRLARFWKRIDSPAGKGHPPCRN